MIMLSVLAAAIASLIGATVTYFSGGNGVEIAVAYGISGLTGFVVPAILSVLAGRSAVSEQVIAREMLALRETHDRHLARGEGIPDVALRGELLQAQLRSGLPRSHFGG